MTGAADVGDLPASPEIERTILGCLLLSSDLWSSTAQALRPQDLSLDAHQRIFRVMIELGQSQGTFDPATVADKLGSELQAIGGPAYLADLTSGVARRKDITPLCKIVREKATLRRLVIEAEALQRAALEPGAEVGACRQKAAEMVALCDRAPSSRLRAAPLGEFLSLEIPPRQMVLAPVLPTQGLAMLYSKRGVGKTYLGLGIAHAVARGGSFLRWRALTPRRVLFVDGELPAITLQQRLKSIEVGIAASEPAMPSPDYLRIITPDMQNIPMPDLATREGQSLVERELGDAELLVLDNLSALCRYGNENEGESWLPMQGWLLRLRQQHHSVLLVHHAGKSGAQRGTSRREDLLDTVISLQHPSDYNATEGLRCEVRYEKARAFHGDEAKPFEVRMHLEGEGAARWSTKDAEDSLLERAAALFREGATVRGAAEELGISRGKAERLKHKAGSMGLLPG